MIKKEVQTSSKLNLIYNSLKKGISPSHINKEKKEENSICSTLNIKKPVLSYYLSLLKNLGIIQKKGYGTWEIIKDLSEEEFKKEVQTSSNKKSIGMMFNKPITNLHALEIKFPILEGKIEDSNWEIKNKLNNWFPKYKGLTNLGGLTIRNNNNKSITVFLKARNIKNLSEVDNLAFKVRSFIFEYFKKKYNVILNVLECETKNLNLATEDKQSEQMLRKGEKFELKFNKNAEKIFKQDKIRSKAWIDGSPFKFTAETNDKEWKKEYLSMPFSVRDIHNSLFLLDEYNKNLKLHTKVQKEQLKTQKEIQKLLKNIRST